MPHSFIIGQGLMPVPPEAPSIVRRSIFASEPNRSAIASSCAEYAPVLSVIRLNPISRSRSISSRKPSFETKPRREWRSNSLMLPAAKAFSFSVAVGSGRTM